MSIVRHKLLREFLDAPSLEVLKIRLDGALATLEVEEVPAYGRGAGTRWSLGSLPTCIIL